MLGYLFRGSRAKPEVPEGGKPFYWHRKSGVIAILVAVALLVVVETAAVHFLLSMWSRPAAWVLTALSIYSLLLIVAHTRALVLRPHVVTDTHLLLRNGALLSAEIPLVCIETVETSTQACKGEPEILNAAAPLGHNVIVTLRAGREATAVYGFKVRFRKALLRADDPGALEAALRPTEPKPVAVSAPI